MKPFDLEISCKHPFYTVYKSMKARCYNKSNKSYNNYGGKGIVVCELWLNDYKAFIQWLIANGYQKGKQIDRIDNNGNYQPDNCRVVTASQNNRNKSNNTIYNGKTLIECCEDAGVNYGLFHSRLYIGWSKDDALNPEKKVNRLIVQGKSLRQYCLDMGMNYCTVKTRLHRGWPLSKAIKTNI